MLQSETENSVRTAVGFLYPFAAAPRVLRFEKSKIGGLFYDSNDNQYYIYLRSTKQRIPCTKEQFDDYYRDINAYRRTQQNHGRCVCAPSKRLSCDMDCCSCPYHTPGDMSSLDSGLKDDDGEEMNWLDHLQETMPDLQTPSPADYVSGAIYMRQILDRLCEIMRPRPLKLADSVSRA